MHGVNLSIYKNCDFCGKKYYKKNNYSLNYWKSSKFCSRDCSCLHGVKLKDERRPPMHIKFWEWVDKKGENDCWNWKGATSKGGYGAFSYEGKMYRANRVVLELNGLEIPDGMYACHKCDNPNCVNPNHLYVGTPKMNIMDKINRGRSPRGEKCYASKLTDDQVRSIREDPRSNDDIASDYGVTRGNIYQIKARKTWRHI